VAIDSAEKRAAIASLGLPWLAVTVTVNVVHDDEWRQEAGFSYPGIDASGEAPAGDGVPPLYWQQQMAATMMRG
jgi:hypothetical protein